MAIHQGHTRFDSGTVLGNRLRQARLWAGISQEALGVAIGLDRASGVTRISRYESGAHEPSIAVARQLAQALAVPLAFLYCDADDMALILLHVNRGPGSACAHALSILEQR